MKTQPKFYNLSTKFYHKTLKRPFFFKKSLEILPESPTLTVVFLHGISADSSTWQKTFINLKKNNDFPSIRFIALDLLGFGKSLKADWLNYDFKEFDKALKNSLKKYHIKTPIILIGHSMGCLIAANFAKSNKKLVKNLVLISPPIIKKDEIAKLPDKFYAKTYSSIEKFANTPSLKTLAKFAESASSFRGQYLDTKAFNETMKNLILNPHNFNTFCELSLPTTIIHGRLDPLVIGKNLDEIAQQNTHIRLSPVMSTHDISRQKYDKMILALKKALNDD